jgi:hypothetical protein
MPNSRRGKRRKSPPLVRLRYGSVYCELCRDTIGPGQLVAWWAVPSRGRGRRNTAYCATCHHANVRHGKALY